MTCEQIEQGRWRLGFTEAEALFLINILTRLGRDYEANPAQMPAALRAFWEGRITRGEPSGQEELKEAQEALSEARAELRSERLALVENWVQEFELAENRDPWKVEISSAERDEFVAMLNDRRLIVALALGITEEDMEAAPNKISGEERRHAIMEIDVLGHFILVTLGPQIYRP